MEIPEFICGDEEVGDRGDELLALYENGLLQPWRIDAQGRQWFRRVPEIHGVPPAEDCH